MKKRNNFGESGVYERPKFIISSMYRYKRVAVPREELS
jgi:hypothetical protein